ncbi:glycosyltransferase family 39 protein [Pelomonas sp. KK5]|uniref:ArnT family glycosyltransferase n=1 Tax=Pelomonas sp. KK5 TaxID=1855730 RepID=UPI00097CA163|nr:glycosyltransferase family 39 protein [Pelomonas sp. KK5]
MSAVLDANPRGRAALLCAVALLAWLGATAGLRLLTLPDEGRYVGVAWEMLRSGDWLTPTLDGMPFFHKPPLFYWITAASLKLFGLHPWAGRAASIIGATLGAFALHAFTRRWCDAATARRATLLLAAQPLFYIGAQFANLDMLVAGCISATVLLLADAALRIEAALPARASLWGAYALAALGVLAKGLIGFVLPGLIVTLWLLSGGRWRTLLRLLSPVGLLLFLAIAAPWFLAMQQRFPDFLHYFFVVQHFQRFAAGGFNNVQPFWFYPAVLAAGSLAALPGLAALLRRPREAGRADVRRLMGVWLLVIVGFFSLPASKLVGYVLPAVVPLAWLMAEGLQALPARWWRAALGLSALLSVGVVIGLAVHPLRNSRDLAAALSANARADEPLVMLRQYAYDLPFYARLAGPVTVVDDWSDPAVQASDNWRKELADAGLFAPAAAARLIEPAALTATLCRSPVSFVLGEDASAWPQLAGAQALAQQRGLTLWRVEAARLDCGAAAVASR